VIIDHSWGKWAYSLKAEGGTKAPVLGVFHAPIKTMYGSWPPVFPQLPPIEKACAVCISEDQARQFKEIHDPCDVRVCYNGVDTEFYKPIEGIKRSNRFLFLARFSTIKGPLLAIQACKEVGVGLDLVGDTSITQEPEYFQKCKSLCDGEQIRMVGPASRGECVWWFSQAHALIHPNFPAPKLGHPGFREPFGLAPVEAQLCFPADTLVRASGIQRTYISSYTGTLLQLRTDYGAVECTPEHPFMTQRGWVAAKDLTLVDSLTRVRHGRYRVDEERIRDLAQRLSDAGYVKGRQITEQIEGFGKIEGFETRIVERGQTAVYTKREEGIQEEDSHPYGACFQHVQTNDRLGSGETSIPERNRRQIPEQKQQGTLQRESFGQVVGNISGVQVSEVLQDLDGLSGNQKTTNGNNLRMVQDSSVSSEASGIAREVESTFEDAPLYELARLRHITRREVRNLPVYNLGTRTGDYEAAGYLVHNCGCPVIAGDYGAMRETVKNKDLGWLVGSMDELVKGIRHMNTMNLHFTHDFSRRCREWAMRFSIQRMVDRYEELCVEAVGEGGW